MRRYSEINGNYGGHGGGFEGYGGSGPGRFTGAGRYCPPPSDDERPRVAPPNAIDPDGNPTDDGYSGHGRFGPDFDGYCAGYGHAGPWGHGFGYHGRGVYPHARLQSEEFLAKIFGLLKTGLGLLEDSLPNTPFLGLLGGNLHEGLAGLLGPIPGRAGRRSYDEDQAIAHLAQFLTKGLDKFATVAHWGIPGFDRGGFGEPHYFPKPCIEPPELGFKVFRYNPDTGDLIDLNDGDGDPGRGNSEPGHRYPWAQEEHQNTLYVGVLNGNPNPLHLLPAALSLFTTEIPFAPTLHTGGPEIWRWVQQNAGGSKLQVEAPDGGQWEKVFDADDLGGALGDQIGIRELFSYDGYLYATTSNNVIPLLLQGSREPAMMIRSKSGDPGTWEAVPRGPGTDDDPFDDPTNTSIRTIEQIGGLLVVGTEKASALLGPQAGDPELWTFDGTTWTQIKGEVEGFAISEIVGMQDPNFFASVQDGAAEAVRADNFDQPYFGNWDPDGYNLYTVEPAKPGDTGDPNAPEFNAQPVIVPPVIVDVTPTHVRYVGQGPNLPAGAVPDYIIGDPDANGLYDADDFGDISPFDDQGIIKMFQFDPNPRDEEPGYLYFGTVDFQDGATLMRSQTPDVPSSWELITADGFFSEFGGEAVNTPESGPVPVLNGNFYIWSAAVTQRSSGEHLEATDDPNQDTGVEDTTLYIGTFNGLNGSGQILKSNDGVNFDYVTHDAFGAENIYGFRSMEVIRDEVFFGGASPITTPDPFSFPYAPEDPFAFDLI